MAEGVKACCCLLAKISTATGDTTLAATEDCRRRPDLDPKYIEKIKTKSKPGDQNSIVEMDPGSFKTLDKSYFRIVAKRRGLLQSDEDLQDDIESKSYLEFQTLSHGSNFFKDFGDSMVKMSRVNVKSNRKSD
ncbi:Peroxidase 27 [Abeliophyllum distichum]|uniref:peroxidase n=1 Tax=Abeliophyllum distichum TaxID=126358 RepID=A0ABD1UG14_9LAMI